MAEWDESYCGAPTIRIHRQDLDEILAAGSQSRSTFSCVTSLVFL